MLGGAKDHLDFGEQFPYAPEKKAQLKAAGFAATNPLRDTITTSGAEPALPTVATFMKRQDAKIGVDVTVEVIDRPILLRRYTRDRDCDQVVDFSDAALDSGWLAKS